MSHQKRVLRPIRSDVAPPVTSPPVYRGDIDARGTAQDLVPRSLWVDFWDTLFFIFAGIAALVLTFMILANTVGHSFWGFPIAFIFWAVTAYLTLPRFHAIMTRIYVPDYFIGRTRTPDGLLGDPVNIGLIGTEEQIHQVMQDAGWTRADNVTLVSSWKIILSTITRRSYAEAPVSPLKIFGKTQAFAYQKEVDGNPEKRHHVRFWKTPDGWLLPGGHQVDWLAAGTYDSGVGFSFFTLQVTHRIDAETDFERDYIVESIQYAHPETHVEILHDFSSGYHARNGGGDAIRTDGALPVIVLNNEGLEPQEQEEIHLSSAHDLAYRMPLSLLVGSGMLIAVTLADIVNSVILALSRPALRAKLLEEGSGNDIELLNLFDQVDSNVLLTITGTVLVGFVAIYSAVHLFLLWSTLRGSSKARRLALLLTALNFAAITGGVLWGHQSLPLSTIFFQLGVAVFAMLAFTSDAAVQYTATRTFHMRDTKIVQRATHPKVLEHRAQRKAQKAEKAQKAQKMHNAQKARKATSASSAHRT
ncbi:LssY C-terminal domain-containing protein [Rothia mucilaginosa]|uniref:LssY C-terminal domain-containing protein n=1 Tax=Rothia mucilaginosa TaxID=43675 RepID=UPI0025FB0A94|nr:LssY C-terminal domain-containing protein [Rothia mucilaginosa]